MSLPQRDETLLSAVGLSEEDNVTTALLYSTRSSDDTHTFAYDSLTLQSPQKKK